MAAGIEIFYPTGRVEWREWLHQHHNTYQSIWLLYYKKSANKPTVSYTHAVDEALCDGIDQTKKEEISKRLMGVNM